ncbi:GNAT family N-acetyltransferase [Merismopedia glauca]|uniref:GNAT family N-acetyltransferase n=1 Tax=Merismopedia glauca CCAP 1448/3 TaxID=1296344 RepID=A0A2T1BY24_9CYAN|nr:GNAT family N-acetyltransferase [Merismopedia glauca]PSB00935.1 GNAT family N-acetyltransferase [Merismopedia glauca CCAP 1448/3]
MDDAKIQFCDRKSQIDLQQLQTLFQEGAFWAQNRTLEDLAIAITHSNPAIGVWDGSRLIGFARATSDGVYRATIWDVVIHPDYRGVGLGKKLVETLLSHPLMHRVERVYLMTTYQQKFYEGLGFETNSSTTMVLNNQLISRGDRRQFAEMVAVPELSVVKG